VNSRNYKSKAIKREFEEMKQRIKEDSKYGEMTHPKISWWRKIINGFNRIKNKI